ncbi:hypothetical protein [Anaeromusa sp.]|uniref:hypothetical protein n=1 Tax=Anaeromusa sp. TaxID=1872520 RepID=UPI00260B91FC|nr:hypothetical protein [Anaeromusa sp.]MDD3157036.1 hypothetical protein [Anaeromusa sp.]
MGRGGAIYVPADNRWSALGMALGQMMQQQQQKKEEQDALNTISQALNPSVNSTDTSSAQNQIMQQMGLGGLSGQDARQVLADKQQQWQGLEDSKANLTNQKDIDAVNQQQQTIHAQADRVRQLLGASLGSGFGAGDDAAASYEQMRNNPSSGQQQYAFDASLTKGPAGTQGQYAFNSSLSSPSESTSQANARLGSGLQPPQQQSSYQPATISFDAINQNGQYSPEVQKLVSGIAQLRAQSSPDIMKALMEKGYSPQTMQKAQQYLGIVDAQQKAKQNAPMIAQIAAALQNSGNSVGGSVAQWALQNGIDPKAFMEYMKNLNPEYKAQDLGGQTLMYPQNGTGYGPAQTMQNSLSPGDAFKGQVSMRNTDSTNQTHVLTTGMNNKTSLQTEGMRQDGANGRLQYKTQYDNRQQNKEDKARFEKAKYILGYDAREEGNGVPMGNRKFTPDEVADASSIVSAYGSGQGQQQNQNSADNGSAFKLQSSLSAIINSQGPDAARKWVETNKQAILNSGLDPDIAMSWIPE